MPDERSAIEALVGRPMPRGSVTVRRRPNGTACTVHPWGGRFSQGEYNQTVVIPAEGRPNRAVAAARLASLLDRRFSLDALRAARCDERAACDVDGDVEVDDDMPAPRWRTHAPAALRHALDAAGIDREDVVDLLQRERLSIGRATIQIGEVTDTDLLGERWVRGVTIAGGDAVYTQSITVNRLRIAGNLPHAVVAGAIGRHASQIVGLPGFDAPGLVVVAARTRRISQRDFVDFTMSRSHAALADVPGAAAS